MKQRGRKSAAARAAEKFSVVAMPERPRAPEELEDEAAAVWDSVVGCHPSDWLAKDAHPLLIQYCRMTVRLRRIAQALAALESEEDFDAESWHKFMALERDTTRVLLATARSLRICHQSRYRADSKSARPVTIDSSKLWK